jgi:hypothetical protein
MWITGLLIAGPLLQLLWNKLRQQLFDQRENELELWELDPPMCKKDEYRSFAALCLAVATKTSDTAKKARLLGKAAAWLELAERVTPLTSKLQTATSLRARIAIRRSFRDRSRRRKAAAKLHISPMQHRQ